MRLKPVDADEVRSYLNSIKTKACGIDDISPEIMKYCRDDIAEVLARLINLSFKTGRFPQDLKAAKVLPIHKGGDMSDIKNRRPVSILNGFSKVFEKCMYTRLLDHLMENNLITSSQHGFLPNHSTETAIIQFINRIYNSLENKKVVAGVFIDFSKAFDCLDHNILGKKLENLGIRGPALKLFRCYLSNRKQSVFYDNIWSKETKLEFGVPQGSLLGPLLFLVYINDIGNSTKELDFTLYADDVNALKSDVNKQTLIRKVNMALVDVTAWVNANKLCINQLKLVSMFFSNSTDLNMFLPLSMCGVFIPEVYHTKFLGLTLDSILKWSYHISNLVSHLSRLYGIVYLSRDQLTQKTLLSIYYS